MNDDLRTRAMEECLALNRQALAIFDAIEARSITMDTARAVVAMGRSANALAAAISTLVLTGAFDG